MNLDVIVTGTGRCGSSFVSMVLHQDFSVCMGHDLNTKPDEKGFHRWGAWEFKKGSGKVLKHKEAWAAPKDKIFRVLDLAHPKTCYKTIKGIKSPWLSIVDKPIWHAIIEKYNTQLVIIPWRPLEDVIISKTIKWVPSMSTTDKVQKTAWTLKSAHNLNSIFRPPAPTKVLEIDFTEEVSREELREILKPHIDSLLVDVHIP